MSEPAAPAVVPPAPAKPGGRELRELLEALVPDEMVEIVDVFGQTYRLRTRLPARAEMLVIRQLEKLTDVDVDAAGIRADLSGGATAILRRAVDLAGQPGVLEAVSEAFAVAHPEAVARARAAHDLHGDSRITTGPLDAADLFPLEELVTALLPFGVRILRRLLPALDRMTEA